MKTRFCRNLRETNRSSGRHPKHVCLKIFQGEFSFPGNVNWLLFSDTTFRNSCGQFCIRTKKIAIWLKGLWSFTTFVAMVIFYIGQNINLLFHLWTGSLGWCAGEGRGGCGKSELGLVKGLGDSHTMRPGVRMVTVPFTGISGSLWNRILPALLHYKLASWSNCFYDLSRSEGLDWWKEGPATILK